MSYAIEIDPVTAGRRPQWSVMIPAYNQADYLEKTIRSVLEQDPGSDQMQVEVVDDHSAKEDLARVVKEVGRGRVQYFRQQKNVGVVENFNTCIRRSRGRWVHILHGDDMVQPGFYVRMGTALEEPGVGIAICGAVTINERDEEGATVITPFAARGVAGDVLETLAVDNYIRTPAVAIARGVYEAIGGFDPRLPHCADWDMWKRVAAAYKVYFEPDVLARYREHSASDTSKLVRSGRNLVDLRRSIEFSKSILPGEKADELVNTACDRVALYAHYLSAQSFRRNEFRSGCLQAWQGMLVARSGPVRNKIIALLGNEAFRYLSWPVRATRCRLGRLVRGPN